MRRIPKFFRRSPAILPPSRTATERMMEIHSHLNQGKYPNCQNLARLLEVSSKTIQRDLEFMKTRMGFPIDYDAERYGYYYTQAVDNYPLVQVSQDELVALYVAQMVLRQYTGTPYEKALRGAFEKITAGLSKRLTVSWNDLDTRLSFKSVGATPADFALFNKLSQAVLQSMEVEFEYRKLYGSRSYERRRVQPYHLGAMDGQWYLFGFDRKREEMRTFVLSRMRKLYVTAFQFIRPEHFSIAEYLGKSFGVYKGHGSHIVRIRFDRFASQLIQERQWHPSQKVRKLKNGTLEMTLKLEGLPEIERWILSWGIHAQVLAPAELQQSLAATAIKLSEQYKIYTDPRRSL